MASQHIFKVLQQMTEKLEKMIESVIYVIFHKTIDLESKIMYNIRIHN